MNYRKMLVLGVLAVVSSVWAVDFVEVTNVVARQRYPWNGLVDIDFQLDFRVTEPYQMYVEAFDNVGKTNLPVRSVYVPGISYPDNPCMVRADTTRIIWDAAKDLPNGFKCENVLISCRDTRMVTETNRYVIVDLSAGPNADSYPVTYASQPPRGGWTEEYMTTKLVLRRINPGSFVMGSPLSESGRSDNEDRHVVTLTKPYYIAVYELTVKQYSLIMGGDNDGDDTKPVEKDWYTIRGLGVRYERKNGTTSEVCSLRALPNENTWPYTTNVAGDSLCGVLRSKTRLQFDLPTEAQWEKACRAGTITPLYTGVEDSELNRAQIQGVAKPSPSGTYVVYVGLYLPNSYGLYDMQGSVSEWCLDGYLTNLGMEVVIDPVGPVNIPTVTRGYGHYSSGGSFSLEIENYIRTVRGLGGRSGSRTSGWTMIAEAVKDYSSSIYTSFLKDMTEDCAKNLPVAGIRLAIPLDE